MNPEMWVYADEEGVNLAIKNPSMVEDDDNDLVPSCVLTPQNARRIAREIVECANEYEREH